MSRITLIYHTNIKFYTQYTHPTLIYRGTNACTDGRTENIYSIFRDKLLLLGEHVAGYRFPRKKSSSSSIRIVSYCKYDMYFDKYDMYSIVGIEKNVRRRNWYNLHTYVRTQYKPKILHT